MKTITITWTATFKTTVEVPDTSTESLAAAAAINMGSLQDDYEEDSMQVLKVVDEKGQVLYNPQ